MAPKQKPGRSSQDYGTPKIFLSAVMDRLGIDAFELDVCSDKTHANRLKMYMRDFYTPKRSGLLMPWAKEGWNWCNPPFGSIRPWVRRAWVQSRKGASTAVLIPASPGSDWWKDWVHHKAMVLFLNGRITFVGTPANPKTGLPDAYPKDCALLLYTPVEVPRYDIWNWREP